MRIGVPKETFTGETRVAGSPETVKKLVKLGLEVFVAKGAGKMAFFLDADYKEAGAKLCSQKDAFEADLILKVRIPFGEEVGYIKS